MSELKPSSFLRMSTHETELQGVGVHLQPQQRNPPRDPEARQLDEDARDIPYPRWSTLMTRGASFILEVVALGYTGWFIAKWGSYEYFPSQSGPYGMALLNCALGVALQIIIYTLTLLKRYSGWWMVVVLVDMAIAALGLVAVVQISLLWPRDRNSSKISETEWAFWEESKNVSMFQLVMGIVHIIAILGGFVGCCLVFKGK